MVKTEEHIEATSDTRTSIRYVKYFSIQLETACITAFPNCNWSKNRRCLARLTFIIIVGLLRSFAQFKAVVNAKE